MQAASTEDVRGWLLALCAETGLTISEIARRAKISPSTLTRFLKNEASDSMLSGRTLLKLKLVEHSLRLEDGRSDAYSHDATPSVVRDERSAFLAADPTPVRLFQLELAPADITGPEGSEGLEILKSDSPVQDGRPWSITGGDDIRRFAIYMPGEFMRPRFRTGECLIIDNLRPAAIGSDVLVEFVARPGEATLGTIAELIDRDRNQVRLRQLQHQTSATVHRSCIRRVLPVVGTFRGDVSEVGFKLNFG